MYEPVRKYINKGFEYMEWEMLKIERMGHREAGTFYGFLTLFVLSIFFMCWIIRLDREEKKQNEWYKEEAKKYQKKFQWNCPNGIAGTGGQIPTWADCHVVRQDP